MSSPSVGISGIAAFIPRPRISLQAILDHRVAADPSQNRRLPRAIESTGQRAIRFPETWDDSVTLAANASLALLGTAAGQAALPGLRHIVTGTETSVDGSKPISSWLGGIIRRAGFDLPPTHSNFQVQHACAGGTLGLLSVAALLAAGGRSDTGLVVASDIARYQVPSTAEFTQGAGAVAMLVETNPRLLTVDLGTLGASSADVDDFFRPTDSVTARVKGQYSMQCYTAAADQAFLDHCARRGESPAAVLDGTDIFVFHVPFAKMAYTAARQLLTVHRGLHDGAVDAFLNERLFFEPLELTAEVGNVYTGASFLNLQANLLAQWKRFGDGIVGKRVLFTSYGSGNTMVVASMTVRPGAPGIIAAWEAADPRRTAREADMAEYERWVAEGVRPVGDGPDRDRVPAGQCYLERIREDGYREYALKS